MFPPVVSPTSEDARSCSIVLGRQKTKPNLETSSQRLHRLGRHAVEVRRADCRRGWCLLAQSALSFRATTSDPIH